MGSMGAIAFFMNSGGTTTVPSGVIAMWAGTNATIPTGWTRVTTLDGRYVKGVATSGTNPGGTGGASSHSHTGGGHTHTISHTHSWPNTSNSGGDDSDGQYSNASGVHSHPVSDSGSSPASSGSTTATWSTDASVPMALEVIFIQSDGTPSGVPNSALAFYNGAAPTGFTAYANASTELIKGAATGGNGGTLVGGSHTHTGTSHTHDGSHSHYPVTSTAPTGDGSLNGNVIIYGAPGSHTHSLSGSGSATLTLLANSDSAVATTSIPPWRKLRVVQNTSGANKLPTGIICMWLGTLASIPLKWVLCDTTNGTPQMSDGRYVYGAESDAAVGTTGGTSTHTHTTGHTHGDPGAHSHSAPTSVGAPSTTYPTGENVYKLFSRDTHTHTAYASNTGTLSIGSGSVPTDAVSNDPLYTEVAFIQYTG